jgi:hypothetical protein
MITDLEERAGNVLTSLENTTDDATLCETVSEFLSDPPDCTTCGLNFLRIVLEQKGIRKEQ